MADPNDFSKQQTILDRLKDELEQAKALYESSKQAYEKAKKLLRLRFFFQIEQRDAKVRYVLKATVGVLADAARN